MAGFQDVVLEWGGHAYPVPAERLMGLVCRVEDALCIDPGDIPIDVLLNRQSPARVAGAFEVALRYAGAQIAPGEVYLSIMENLAQGNGDVVIRTRELVMHLLSLIAPPIHSEILRGMGAGSEKK